MDSLLNSNPNHTISQQQLKITLVPTRSDPKEQISAGNPITWTGAKSVRFVETNLEEQNATNRLRKTCLLFPQDDSDSDLSIEDQDYYRYRAPQYQESQEDEEDFCVYSSGSTMPPYLTMTRFQRINYFNRLNSQYMRKMSISGSEQNLKPNSETKPSQIKRKTAIKFSQIVFELPFGKQDRPSSVDLELQEETFIKFDDEAYQIEEEEDDQNVSEDEENQPPVQEDYFDELAQFDFDARIKDTIFMENQKVQNQIEDSFKEEGEKFTENQDLSFPSSPKMRQNIGFDDFGFDEEDGFNAFKRDANRQVLSEASTSSDSNSSESSGSQWREADYNEELESYFALYINGRKINPNALQSEGQTCQQQ